jgi:betaine-aldehyde dehydrogenase
MYSQDLLRCLPVNRGLYYGGEWHEGLTWRRHAVSSPATQALLGEVVWAESEDVDAAVRAALAGFEVWKRTPPLRRAATLQQAAAVLRQHRDELALIDAIDGGNPVRELMRDIEVGAFGMEWFAGQILSLKGEVIPMPDGQLNYTLRQPMGVVARISAFNHPLLFAAMKIGAPLAAGNAVIVKSPDQAPLSTLRLAEIIGPLFPPGVFNVLSGGRACGEAIVTHPGIAKIGLIGSAPTGRAILRAAADGMKRVTLELGGKNALVAYADTDPLKVAKGIIAGMNFAWCGQSCGSTSRAFLHASLHDEVLAHIKSMAETVKPGDPIDPDTEMGCLISQQHLDKVAGYIASGKEEGASLVTGGKAPEGEVFENGAFLLPTIFSDVKPHMKIAREEIFGPVLSVLRWDDPDEMIAAVNDVEYGLTAAAWTNDLNSAMHFATEVQAGFVWINNSSQHFLGAPFGGVKQSGLGREEGLGELFDCTEIKNVNITFAP